MKPERPVYRQLPPRTGEGTLMTIVDGIDPATGKGISIEIADGVIAAIRSADGKDASYISSEPDRPAGQRLFAASISIPAS